MFNRIGWVLALTFVLAGAVQAQHLKATDPRDVKAFHQEEALWSDQLVGSSTVTSSEFELGYEDTTLFVSYQALHLKGNVQGSIQKITVTPLWETAGGNEAGYAHRLNASAGFDLSAANADVTGGVTTVTIPGGLLPGDKLSFRAVQNSGTTGTISLTVRGH